MARIKIQGKYRKVRKIFENSEKYWCDLNKKGPHFILVGKSGNLAGKSENILKIHKILLEKCPVKLRKNIIEA